MAREDHSNPLFIGSSNDLVIADRAARLNYRRDPGLSQYIKSIAEGEERIGSRHGSMGLFTRLLDCNACRIHAVRLAAAGAAGARPEDCTVFDDSLAACQGARAARMRVVGVYDGFFAQNETEMQGYCDVFIKSFEELLWMPERKKRT